MHLDRVLKTGEVSQTPPPPKECPTVSDFVPMYLDASRLQNKPSSVDSKKERCAVTSCRRSAT
jgi:hypothetical protein